MSCCFFGSFVWIVTIGDIHQPMFPSNNYAVILCLPVTKMLLSSTMIDMIDINVIGEL